MVQIWRFVPINSAVIVAMLLNFGSPAFLSQVTTYLGVYVSIHSYWQFNIAIEHGHL